VRPRILVVDDDPGILDVVSFALDGQGFDVQTATDGQRALDLAQRQSVDVLVLDLMLPVLSGTEVCRRLRAGGNAVPVLMLTARDAEVDRVLGLEMGADDYLTKPFSTAELVSRIRAILRRRELDRAATRSAVIQVGGVRIDLARHEISVDDETVRLTPSEYKLLVLLAGEPDRVFTRRRIMEHLWESEWVGDEHAADVHISNLRRKLERDTGSPERVVTVRGFGYKLVSGESGQRTLTVG
jgi:two-component system response regulator RegX3